VLNETGQIGDRLAENLDLDAFRISLNRMYESVILSYGNSSNLVLQINIHLDNLRKQFVKSGIFRADDTSARNFIDFLVNELEVCMYSDESIVINERGFYADFIVTKNAFISGHTWPDTIFERPIYWPNAYKQMYNKISVVLFNSQLINQMQFISLLKYGLMDISLLCKTTCNCVDLAVTFHVLALSVCLDYSKAISIFLINYQCDGNKLIRDKLLKNGDSDNRTIDYLVRLCRFQLKMPAVIMSKKTQKQSKF
jgi:hypothetical protein